MDDHGRCGRITARSTNFHRSEKRGAESWDSFGVRYGDSAEWCRNTHCRISSFSFFNRKEFCRNWPTFALQLSVPFKMTNEVNIVPLATKTREPNTFCEVAGWGYPSEVSRIINVDVSRCTRNFLCSGWPNGKQSSHVRESAVTEHRYVSGSFVARDGHATRNDVCWIHGRAERCLRGRELSIFLIQRFLQRWFSDRLINRFVKEGERVIEGFSPWNISKTMRYIIVDDFSGWFRR